MIAIYARQSVDKKDSISIETQIDLCKKEITEDQDYTVFQDKGYSGKNTNRPAFKKMLESVERNEISKVIVYRLDRISRSITDFASIVDLLEEHKVSFASTNEKFDTSTPMGRAMLYIIMVFAQLERETIAERIKDNYYSRGKKGVWLGGPAPLGFTNKKVVREGKKVALLEPNNDIEIVKYIFNTYANTNLALGGIAKELRKKHGGMWNNIKLARIIHNPAYVKADADVYHYYQYKKCIIVNDIDEFIGGNGCSLYGKRDRGANKYNALEEQVLAIALHEGIIDSKTWLFCQNKTSKNQQIKNTGKGKHSWITGLVKCGYCGYGMIVRIYGDYKYMVCTGRYATDLCKEKLSTHYLKDVEAFVRGEIFEFVDKLKKNEIHLPKNDPTVNLNDLKIELHKVESEIQNLLNSISVSNDVLMKYINEKIIDLDKKKNEILKEMNAQVITPTHFEIPDISGWDKSGIEFKRDIASKFISSILIYDDKIEVAWKH